MLLIHEVESIVDPGSARKFFEELELSLASSGLTCLLSLSQVEGKGKYFLLVGWVHADLFNFLLVISKGFL
jgi:hypothetical protein